MKSINAQITVLTGHFGSGKSELAINFAMEKNTSGLKTAVIDLDIANPYFRSRELQGMLTELGIDLVSNAYGYDITADLPALSPMINSYILDPGIYKIIDAGGNDSGARVLNQYKAALKETNAEVFVVVNIYRPETDSIEKIIRMIDSIKNEIGLGIMGLISNSNLLRATKLEHVVAGIDMLESVSKDTGIPVTMICCERHFCRLLEEYQYEILPMDIYLRPKWLDM